MPENRLLSNGIIAILGPQLGLFRMNGLICGRPDTIRARIAEAESVSREDAGNEVA